MRPFIGEFWAAADANRATGVAKCGTGARPARYSRGAVDPGAARAEWRDSPLHLDLLRHHRTQAQRGGLQKHRQRLEESEARLRELAEFLQTVREEERTRIARELHDELGQALTALRIDLGWLRGKCGGLGEPAAERVAAALGVVEQSIVSLRRISEDLRPAMLDSLGSGGRRRASRDASSPQRTGIPCQLRMNREEFELRGSRRHHGVSCCPGGADQRRPPCRRQRA